MPETTLSDVEAARVPTPAEATEVAKLYAGRTSEFLGVPLDATADHCYPSTTWADGTLAIALQPDVPRNLTATLTDGDNSVTGVLTITGLDYAGRTIVETMEPLGDGNGKALVGTQIFAEITSQVITATAGAAGGDVLVIGVGDVIGVPYDLEHTGAVAFAYLGGTKLTPDAVATGAGTSGVDVNGGTMDGAKWLHVIMQPARTVA